MIRSSPNLHTIVIRLPLRCRALVFVLTLVMAIAGPFAQLMTQGQIITGATPARPINKRDEEVFVIYRNAAGESVCREANSEEKRRLLDRDDSGPTRTIYRGGSTRTTDKDRISAPLMTETGAALLPSAGLRIVLHATQQLQNNPTARDAFIVAANRWEAVISTPITVLIDVDFGTTFFGDPFDDSNVLGATASSIQHSTPSVIRQQLIVNAPEADELQLYSALPEPSIPVELNGTTTNATNVSLTWTVARALGLRADITNPDSIPLGQGDAGIGFNSAHTFDFNPSDGITPGALDFDAVVVHEIGHALGFTSRSGNDVASPVSVWDMFRFRPGAATLGTIGTAPRVMSEGGEQIFFNNRTNTFGTQELRLSTGGSDGDGGDGEQSSHWKDDRFTAFIGIMDPTLATGRREVITNNDLNALDTFGYKIGGTAPPPQPPPAPANDNFTSAVLLSGATGTVSGTNVGATGESGEPDHASSTATGRRSVWYNWTANASGEINFNTSGSNYDTVLGIYIGNAVGGLSLIGSNDDVELGVITHSTVSFSAVAGTTYRIAVDGFEGDTGTFILNWSGSVPTPTPTPTPTPGSSVFQFSHPAYSMFEHDRSVGILITRTGDTSVLKVVNLTAQGNPPSLIGLGQVIFFPGDTYKIAVIEINDDHIANANQNFNLGLELLSAGTTLGTPSTATLTIFDDDSFPANSVQFEGARLRQVSEGGGMVELTIKRTALSGGNLSQDAFVSYRTFNSSAVDKGDYSLASGTLHFLPGETSKTITVLITEDAFDEPDESFTIQLFKPLRTSVFVLENTVVSVEIQDNDPPGVTTNPSDASASFVTQHYMDFLNRVPDAGGLNFWTQEIEQCGVDAQCREVKRVNVSAAFFLSIEFQETGFLVYRLYKAAYGNFLNTPVPAMHLTDFMNDSQEIGRGVVVGLPGWPELLEARKQAFVSGFVKRGRFKTALPPELTPAQFVDKLNNNIGGLLTQTERDQLVAQLTADNNDAGRASVLRTVAEHQGLRAAELRKAFVLMQYFGYLRRNPNDEPDFNYDGYNFWLNKLNQHNGNFVSAEMVKAFIVSIEYRQRFGP